MTANEAWSRDYVEPAWSPNGDWAAPQWASTDAELLDYPDTPVSTTPDWIGGVGLLLGILVLLIVVGGLAAVAAL